MNPHSIRMPKSGDKQEYVAATSGEEIPCLGVFRRILKVASGSTCWTRYNPGLTQHSSSYVLIKSMWVSYTSYPVQCHCWLPFSFKQKKSHLWLWEKVVLKNDASFDYLTSSLITLVGLAVVRMAEAWQMFNWLFLNNMVSNPRHQLKVVLSCCL